MRLRDEEKEKLEKNEERCESERRREKRGGTNESVRFVQGK